MVEAAKALGGSFKLVTLAPKTQEDDSTAQGNIKEWGHTNKSKSTNEHTKHKPRLNTQRKHSAQPGCMNWSWYLCTWKTSDVQPKCQGPLQLLSPPFLMTSTTKQMRPNRKGGVWDGHMGHGSSVQWVTWVVLFRVTHFKLSSKDILVTA